MAFHQREQAAVRALVASGLSPPHRLADAAAVASQSGSALEGAAGGSGVVKATRRLLHTVDIGRWVELATSGSVVGEGDEVVGEGREEVVGEEEREEEEGYSECPPDRLQYGRHTWTFLHSTGAYFPAQPSEEDKASMRGILSGVGRLFACGHCAQHMRKYMAAHPPDVSGTVGLSTWLCHMHNDVNRRLGKPIFDCSKVLERWRDGPADGSCE